MSIKKFAAGVLAAAAITAVAPATAHADTVTGFRLCDSTCANYVEGKVVWHNRTASVSGVVVDKGAGFTVAKFRAYAGGKQIGDVVSRYADDTSTNPDLKSPRTIGFGMGDTNLPGGLDKIAVYLCFTADSCQHSLNVPR